MTKNIKRKCNVSSKFLAYRLKQSFKKAVTSTCTTNSFVILRGKALSMYHVRYDPRPLYREIFHVPGFILRKRLETIKWLRFFKSIHSASNFFPFKSQKRENVKPNVFLVRIEQSKRNANNCETKNLGRMNCQKPLAHISFRDYFRRLIFFYSEMLYWFEEYASLHLHLSSKLMSPFLSFWAPDLK